MSISSHFPCFNLAAPIATPYLLLFFPQKKKKKNHYVLMENVWLSHVWSCLTQIYKTIEKAIHV